MLKTIKEYFGDFSTLCTYFHVPTYQRLPATSKFNLQLNRINPQITQHLRSQTWPEDLNKSKAPVSKLAQRTKVFWLSVDETKLDFHLTIVESNCFTITAIFSLPIKPEP